MKQAALVMFLCALCCDVSGAQEPALSRGLELRRDAMPAGTRFSGIPFDAVRYTGRDVGVLEQRWLRAMGGDVRSQHVAGWRIHSRVHGAHSEVLQVRENAQQQEAIWSRMPVAGRAPRISGALGPMPGGCEEGPVVEGGEGAERFRQQSATCRSTVADTLRAFEGMARGRGFEVDARWPTGLGLHAASGAAHAMIIALPLPDGRSHLVVLEQRAGRGNTP